MLQGVSAEARVAGGGRVRVAAGGRLGVNRACRALWLVARCLLLTVTVTPRAAGAKPGDVRPGSSAMLGRGGRGGGSAQPGDRASGPGTPRHTVPPPHVPVPSLLSPCGGRDGDRDGSRGVSPAHGEGASAWRGVPMCPPGSGGDNGALCRPPCPPPNPGHGAGGWAPWGGTGGV